MHVYHWYLIIVKKKKKKFAMTKTTIMTGNNSSNDRLVLSQNVKMNSNWYFSHDVFSGIKLSTTWNGNAIAQPPRKMFEFRDISNTNDIRFLMAYRTIIDVILHLFIICNDLWCQLPFFLQTFRHNRSAVFGTMPPMCRGCSDVNKLQGMDTTIFGLVHVLTVLLLSPTL